MTTNTSTEQIVEAIHGQINVLTTRRDELRAQGRAITHELNSTQTEIDNLQAAVRLVGGNPRAVANGSKGGTAKAQQEREEVKLRLLAYLRDLPANAGADAFKSHKVRRILGYGEARMRGAVTDLEQEGLITRTSTSDGPTIGGGAYVLLKLTSKGTKADLQALAPTPEGASNGKLSPTAESVLRLLRETARETGEGRMANQEIRESLGAKGSVMTIAVDQLENKGLVERVREGRTLHLVLKSEDQADVRGEADTPT